MNLSDIQKRVKRQFGDESSVQITDDDITRWANDALIEITNRNELLQVRATADLVTGQMEYELPPDFSRLRSIRLQGGELLGIAMQEADRMFFGYDDPTQRTIGPPQYYWSWGNHFALYPVPDSSKVQGIIMYYSRFPHVLTIPDDTPEIGVEYHPMIVQYCLAQAYELDENLQGMQAKEQQFAQSQSVLAEQENVINDDLYPTITISPWDY